MTYEELNLKYRAMLSEVVRLRKENSEFRNPDFYRAQAMRMPIYDKPRIICCADLDDKYFTLPRGCEEALRDLLDRIGVTYDFSDQRNAGQPIPVSFKGALREEQKAAAEGY